MRPLPSLLLAALAAAATACASGDPADPSADAAGFDPELDAGADAAEDPVLDAAVDAAIDAAPPAVRIRRVSWRWTGCGPDEAAFGLDVDVDVDSSTTPTAIHGDLTGCASFDGDPAHSACAPTLPPTGRVLTVTARRPGAASAAVALPVVDCVGGQWDAPPDDDGDQP